MKIRDYEEIRGLFQTWPESFKERFGRTITKDELIKAIKERQEHLESQAIKTLFCDYSIVDLHNALSFLNQNKIAYIQEAEKLKTSNNLKAKKT